MSYDFDRIIERRGTDSNQWAKYGPDVLPLWVADMDFASPPEVIATHIPIASLAPEVAARTITLMAPSKTFNQADSRRRAA